MATDMSRGFWCEIFNKLLQLQQQTTATRPTLISLPPSQFFLVSSSPFLPATHALFLFDNAQREMHPLKLTACLLRQRHAHVYVHMKRHRQVPLPTKNMRGEQLMRNTMLQHLSDQRMLGPCTSAREPLQIVGSRRERAFQRNQDKTPLCEPAAEQLPCVRKALAS